MRPDRELDDTPSLAEFMRAVEERLDAMDPEELRQILLAHARALPRQRRSEFLAVLMPITAPSMRRPPRSSSICAFSFFVSGRGAYTRRGAFAAGFYSHSDGDRVRSPSVHYGVHPDGCCHLSAGLGGQALHSQSSGRAASRRSVFCSPLVPRTSSSLLPTAVRGLVHFRSPELFPAHPSPLSAG